MTKTEHYSLPQWAATDTLKRSDFNEAMESIDSGLANKAEKSAVTAVETALANYKTSNDAAVAAKAEASAVTAVETALANYKSSNDAAVASAAAKADAAYSPSNQPFEFVTVDTTGMVTGDTVYTFEKAPKFVIVQGSYSCAMVKNGSKAAMVDKIVPNVSSGTSFNLSDTALILQARNDSSLALSLTILAHY